MWYAKAQTENEMNTSRNLTIVWPNQSSLKEWCSLVWAAWTRGLKFSHLWGPRKSYAHATCLRYKIMVLYCPFLRLHLQESGSCGHEISFYFFSCRNVDHVSSNFLTEAKNLQNFSKSLAPIQPPDFQYTVFVLKSQTTVVYRQSLVTLSTNSSPNQSPTQRDFFVVNASAWINSEGKGKKLTGKRKKNRRNWTRLRNWVLFEQDVLSKTSPPPPCKSPRFEVQGWGLERGSGLASVISQVANSKPLEQGRSCACYRSFQWRGACQDATGELPGQRADSINLHRPTNKPGASILLGYMQSTNKLPGLTNRGNWEGRNNLSVINRQLAGTWPIKQLTLVIEMKRKP